MFIFSNHLWSGEKSSKDIQKDIDFRKTELQSLRNEIKDIEERLHLKNKEAISSTEILLNLENKISSLHTGYFLFFIDRNHSGVLKYFFLQALVPYQDKDL